MHIYDLYTPDLYEHVNCIGDSLQCVFSSSKAITAIALASIGKLLKTKQGCILCKILLMRILKKEINKVLKKINKGKGKKRKCIKIGVQLLVGFFVFNSKKTSLQFSTSLLRPENSFPYILFFNSIISTTFFYS